MKHSLRGRKTRSSRLLRITQRMQKNLIMIIMIINALKEGNLNLTKTPKHPTPLLSCQLKTLNMILNHKKMTGLSTNNMAVEREADHPVLSKT